MDNIKSFFTNDFNTVFKPILDKILNVFFGLYKEADKVLPMDLILIGLVSVFLFFFIFRQIQSFSKKIFKLTHGFDFKIYRITIPNTAKNNNEDKKDFKHILAGLELFFYNMAGVEPQSTKKFDSIRFLFKERTDHFSIEIINDSDDLISFYVAVPSHMDTLMRQQLTGVWPDAFVEDMTDYNISKPKNKSIAAEVTLQKHYAFPIKTYEDFESDPLDILLNSLSKFVKGDGVEIQILARSSKKNWREFGKKIVKYVNEGKTVSQAISEIKSNKLLKEITLFFNSIIGKEQVKEDKTHKLSPAEDELIKLMEKKIEKPGMDVNIRILVSTTNRSKGEAKNKLKTILDCLYQYGNYGLLNAFKFKIPKSSQQNKLIKDMVFRNFREESSFVLGSAELITLFHLPLTGAEIANIRWLLARTAPATFLPPEEGIILGTNTYRGVTKDIKVSIEDRMRHMYIIGKSGTGKTNLLKDMAIQDAYAGHGFCVIDPHGDFADYLLSYIPKERAEDVIFFDPGDLERPIGLNLYEFNPNFPEQKTLIINQFIEMLYTMYSKDQIGGPMFEYYTKNALALNMEDVESGNTMIEIPRVMADKEFRHMKLSKCKDPLIKNFWVKEAEKAGGEASLENIVPYITSKLNQFIQNEFMRNIVGQQKSTINFSEIMNTKKILICRLAKGEIGDMNSQLLGLVVTGRILISALARTNIPEKDRHPFFLYIDECQNFLTPAITTILAEARKYGLGLVLANQFITQLTKGNDTTIKDGIFGNAGTVMSFRISTEDAEFMEKQMAPVFTRFDLENSPSGVACAKTLINNSATKPFTLNSRKYWKIFGDFDSPENLEKVKYFKELSRLKYGRAKELVDKDILSRLGVQESNDSSSNLSPEQELARLFGE